MLYNDVKNNSGDHVCIRKRKRKIHKSTTYVSDHLSTDAGYKSNISSIKIAHSNINSIRNKLDHISSELSDYDIICISESKLDDSISDNKLGIEGYRLPLRKDRITNSGGGLVMYIKNQIHVKRRHDLEDTNTENLWNIITEK